MPKNISKAKNIFFMIKLLNSELKIEKFSSNINTKKID